MAVLDKTPPAWDPKNPEHSMAQLNAYVGYMHEQLEYGFEQLSKQQRELEKALNAIQDALSAAE